MGKKKAYYEIKGRRIKLLVPIDDDYYNIHYKVGDYAYVREHYTHGNSEDLVIDVLGHGVYIYALKGQYEFAPTKK